MAVFTLPLMNWFYVDAGQQAGPVDDTQLQALVTSGKIQPGTLVWHEGMANWQPYQEVAQPGLRVATAPPPTAGSAPSASQAACAECGGLFNVQDMISYGNLRVCARCKPIFMQRLAEGARIQTGTFRYAGFWIRVGAKLLDGLILGIIFLPPLLYFIFRNMGAGLRGPPSPQIQIVQGIIQLGYMFVNFAYGIFFLGKYGATPGKMVCKIQVVTAEGGKISYARAAGRVFAEILSGIICYIGYFMVAFDGQKRALHDHICNTRVIYK
jgi:uncharacterized RDD family membrane protein YckC